MMGTPLEAFHSRAEVLSVSVIIPCHNSASTLGLQLEALASQKNPPPFEILLVDNRSTDGPEKVLDQHRDALLAGGATEVRLVRADEESGTSYARNVGAANARFDHLVFCDADDCVSMRWLSDAVALFAQAPVFSGSALPTPESVFVKGRRALHASLDNNIPKPTLNAQEPLAIPILMGGDFGITKDLYLSLGGFDQSLPRAGEDNDLAFRAREAGFAPLDSEAMQIAYRQRLPGRDSRAAARRAARAHVLLCVRYKVLGHSTYVGRLRLVLATAKLFGSAVRMMFRPSRRDVQGLFSRAAGILGFWEGLFLYAVMRRVPPARLGVGLRS